MSAHALPLVAADAVGPRTAKALDPVEQGLWEATQVRSALQLERPRRAASERSRPPCGLATTPRHNEPLAAAALAAAAAAGRVAATETGPGGAPSAPSDDGAPGGEIELSETKLVARIASDCPLDEINVYSAKGRFIFCAPGVARDVDLNAFFRAVDRWLSTNGFVGARVEFRGGELAGRRPLRVLAHLATSPEATKKQLAAPPAPPAPPAPQPITLGPVVAPVTDTVTRHEGICAFYEPKKKHGFIKPCAEGLADIFVHATDIRPGTTIAEGDRVEYCMGNYKGRIKALDVALVRPARDL
eukprot:CAMPEP_0119281414 /NCGR_PEP_ID=MMETSP1329-20130426/24669_1 /TAXON_ID=114041 /ORGANISM="Genus nov. species nov., Strain RCC1024" /LENGTH=300 /DNA_ID=CAMNT_0007282031 /DNA_START=40 /DNA_END=941 /DNA_ORIENTATION=+